MKGSSLALLGLSAVLLVKSGFLNNLFGGIVSADESSGASGGGGSAGGVSTTTQELGFTTTPNINVQGSAYTMNQIATKNYSKLADLLAKNPYSLSAQTIKLANKGSLKQSTYKSIVDYANIKNSGGAGAWEYGEYGTNNAMGVSRAGIGQASRSYQQSPTTLLQRKVVEMNRAAGAGGVHYMVSAGRIVVRGY